MDILFLLLFLFTPVALVLFLIKPSLINKYFKKDLSRKKITLYLSTLTIAFLILFGVTTDATPVEQVQDESTKAAEQIEKDQNVTEEQVEGNNTIEILQDDTNVEGTKVTRVIDGDTIEIEGGEKVRYIGIDTPETVHPTQAIACYGKESSSKNRELVEGKTVRLEKDVSETDRYGRLLRYIYVNDIFVNDYLVRQGFANATSYPPDVKYQSQFSEAEMEAKNNNRGLWGDCGISNQPIQSQVTPQQPSTNTSNCDPAYPSVCIPPAPPDLNCGDISYRRFTVISPDPHNFDRDQDGVGCESL